MNIRQFRYGADNLGYLLYGENAAMAVDGGAAAEMLEFLRGRGLFLQYVTNTHTHMDHTVGNRELLANSRAQYLDFNALLEMKKIELDGQTVEVFHTPGHTRDSVCFYHPPFLVSGDTLFNGKVGKCFTGDTEAFLSAIKGLLVLPDETIVYAGHDYVAEYVAFVRYLEPDNPHIDRYQENYDPGHVCATLADEKKVDPFLRFNDEKIARILAEKGLPVQTESDRWHALLSLM